MVQYKDNAFCKQVVSTEMKGWWLINGLWYIEEQLPILRVNNICKNLFRLAHDTLGHFRAEIQRGLLLAEHAEMFGTVLHTVLLRMPPEQILSNEACRTFASVTGAQHSWRRCCHGSYLSWTFVYFHQHINL